MIMIQYDNINRHSPVWDFNHGTQYQSLPIMWSSLSFLFYHFLLFNIVNHYDPMIVMIDNYDTNQFETAPNLSLAV